MEWIVFLFVLFFLGQDQPSDVWWGNTAKQVEVFYFSWPKATSDALQDEFRAGSILGA